MSTGRVMIAPEDLMGETETINFLGLTPETFKTLRESSEFPLPLTLLDAGPVWLRRDLLKWQKVEPPAGEPRSKRITDPLDHIMVPASKLDDVAAGKKVTALCGKVITHKARPGAPVCRKCFMAQFPGVRLNGVK